MSELAHGSLGSQGIDLLRDKDDLEVSLRGERLEGRPEWLGGNAGWLLDRDVNVVGAGGSKNAHRQGDTQEARAREKRQASNEPCFCHQLLKWPSHAYKRLIGLMGQLARESGSTLLAEENIRNQGWNLFF